MIINVCKVACNFSSSGYRSFCGIGDMVLFERRMAGPCLLGFGQAYREKFYNRGGDHERAAYTALLYRDALRAWRPAGRVGAAQGGDRVLVLRRAGRPRAPAGPRPG